MPPNWIRLEDKLMMALIWPHHSLTLALRNMRPSLEFPLKILLLNLTPVQHIMLQIWNLVQSNLMIVLRHNKLASLGLVLLDRS